MSAIVEVHNIRKYYGDGDNLVKALDDVSLTVEEGEFVTVVGASGSGKSTLLNLLGGLDYATDGDICIDGNYIMEMDTENLTLFRRKNIGFIFQSYNLVPILSVYDNIVLPIELDNEQPDSQYI